MSPIACSSQHHPQLTACLNLSALNFVLSSNDSTSSFFSCGLLNLVELVLEFEEVCPAVSGVFNWNLSFRCSNLSCERTSVIADGVTFFAVDKGGAALRAFDCGDFLLILIILGGGVASMEVVVVETLFLTILMILLSDDKSFGFEVPKSFRFTCGDGTVGVF